jgi:hypothetical protein
MTHGAQDDSDFTRQVNREFELRFLKSRGQAFQELFSELMENAHPSDFRRIRSHGRSGDLKCDGYLESEQTVFQIYGPDEIRSLRTLLKKIDEDFCGASKQWSGRMVRWIFVHNARHGLPAQAIQKLCDLQNSANGVLVENWGYATLQSVLWMIPTGRLQGMFPGTHLMRSETGVQLLPDEGTRRKYWSWLKMHLRRVGRSQAFKGMGRFRVPIRLTTPERVEQFSRAAERTASTGSVLPSVDEFVERQDDQNWHKFFGDHITIGDLPRVLRKYPRILIEGDTGSGKSTLLHRLAREEAAFLLRRPPSRRKHSKTPVLVDLRRFGAEHPLERLILASINRSDTNVSREAFRALACKGYVTLLLDGLDEVPAESRRQCLSEIETLAEEAPRCGLLVTSRPFPTALLPFHKLAIAPLSQTDVVESLTGQYRSVKAFRRCFDHASPADYVHFHMRPEILRLCRRPLTLWMVIALLRSNEGLPASLFKVYERFVSWIFHWESKNERGSSVACIAAVEELAESLSKEKRSISTAEWTGAVAVGLQRLREQQLLANVDAESVTRDVLATGLVTTSDGNFEFSHKSFQDFFSARRTLHRFRESRLPLVEREIALFLCGAVKDATHILEEQFGKCKDVRELLPLLTECSSTKCQGGRFEDLYHAIFLAQEMGVELTHGMTGPRAETFIDAIKEMVQTCVSFKPKALSILKDAMWGILMGTPWEQSALWCECIVNGLEAYGWEGSKQHRRLLDAGYFDRLEVFSYSDEGDADEANYEQLSGYLKALDVDDFAGASCHLQVVLKALGVEEPSTRDHLPQHQSTVSSLISDARNVV